MANMNLGNTTKYSDIVLDVLAESSVTLQAINTVVVGDIRAAQEIKVYLQGDNSIGDYTDMFATDANAKASFTKDTGDYITIGTLKQPYLLERADQESIKNGPANYVIGRVNAAAARLAEDIDKVYIADMVANGESFESLDLADGQSVYNAVLKLRAALNKRKYLQADRSLFIDCDIESLLLDANSKVILSTETSEAKLAAGSLGRLLGFSIFPKSDLGVDSTGRKIQMVCLQKEAYAGDASFDCIAPLTFEEGTNELIGEVLLKSRGLQKGTVTRNVATGRCGVLIHTAA